MPENTVDKSVFQLRSEKTGNVLCEESLEAMNSPASFDGTDGKRYQFFSLMIPPEWDAADREKFLSIFREHHASVWTEVGGQRRITRIPIQVS